MRKEPDLQSYEALFRAGVKIKELEPWSELSDLDLITIALPGSEEPYFCSIMGNGGSCYGVNIYAGREGLQYRNWMVMREQATAPVEYMMFDQNALVMYLGDREEVPDKQKRIIRELGLKFRGRGQWIYFQSFRRRFFPDNPDRDETVLMAEVLDSLYEALVEFREEGMNFSGEYSETLVRAYREKEKRFELVKDILPEVWIPVEEVELNEPEVRKELKACPNGDYQIEIDLAYLGSKVKDPSYDRPVNPLVLIAADRLSGQIVGCHMLNPEDDEVGEVLSMVIELILQNGKMKRIRVRNIKLQYILKELCEYLGIRLELTKKGLSTVDEFLEEIFGLNGY